MGRHVSEDGDDIADYAQQSEPGSHPFDPATATDASAPAVASEPEHVEQIELSEVLDDEPSVAGVEATPDEAVEALHATGYVYTDPAADTAHPRITSGEDTAEDAFPIGWGSSLTERDAAVVEAKGGAQ